jgi:hypothetical protein
MDRKNYTFDASRVINYLPSVWGRNYEDRAVLEKLYAAFARITEADYATVFQVDDAKDLSTLPAYVYYPVVYEKFEDWQSYGTEHAHTKVEIAFDPDAVVTRAGEEYYVVRVPDLYLRGDVQVYSDTRLIPSNCYIIELAPYIEWLGSPLVSTEIDGSTIYLHKDRLDSFLTTVPLSLQESNRAASSPSAAIDRIIIHTLKTAKPFRFVADGATSEYELTGFDDATTLVTADTRVILESVVADNLFTYTSTLDSASEIRVYTIRPVSVVGFSSGAVVKLYFQDGASLYTVKAQIIAGQSSFTVRFNSSATLTGIQLLINFELGRDLVELDTWGLTLKGSNVFFPGARVRVTDDTGVQSFVIDRIQNSLRFEREVDLDSLRISFLGVNILESGVQAGSIKFNGTPTNGVHVLVDATIANAHVHEHYQTVVEAPSPSDVNTIVLPQAAPMVIDPLSAGLSSEFFPLRVYLDGQLLPSSYYTILDSITIECSTFLENGTVVDVHYLNQEELIQHRHVVLSQTVPDDVTVQYAFDMAADVDTAYYLEGYLDGYNYQNTTNLYVKNSRFANFAEGVVTGGQVTLYGTTKSYKYWHQLSDRTETKYQYIGSLIRADWFQDGLDLPTHALAWNSNFTILVEDGQRLLQSNYSIEDGWFLEAQVDERTAQQAWGELAGLIRESSTTYNKVLAAAYAGYRSGSYVGALENFASVLLGSEYLPSAGISRGITNTETGSAADIELLDKTRVQLPIDMDEPDRLLPAPRVMPRFHAINKYVSVIDKDLSSIPYLPWMAEEVSDFRFSKRLDSRASDVTVGYPYSYDPFSAILTDYSIDYTKEEVWAGDLIKIVLDDSAGTDSKTQFTKVVEVLNPHQIRVVVTLVPSAAGYGDGPFGGGVMGGGSHLPLITSYTIWTRKTRPLDVFLRLDEALDRLQTTVSGETIQTINLNIAEILKHFCFAVKVAWSRMTDVERLEDLQTFINIFKPASTKAFVYTEAFEGELSDSLTVDIVDYDIDLSVAGTHEADSWRANESYFGSSAAAYSSEFDLIYNPDQYTIGPKIKSQVKRAPDAPSEGEYYLISTSDVMTGGSSNPFYQTYSDSLGLENLILRVSVEGAAIEYHVDSGFGPRVGGAFRLPTSRRIRVPALSYTQGDNITFSTWIKMQDNGAAFNAPALFQFANGNFTVAITKVSGGYLASFTPLTGGPTVISSELIVDDEWVLIAAVFKDVDGAMLPYIYVNGVETAPDDVVTSDVFNFTEDLFIGATAGSTAGVTAEDSLDCSLDETVVWSVALTATEIANLYTAGASGFTGPIGVSHNPTTTAISALRDPNTLVVFHYDQDFNTDEVYDYSGLANNGVKEGNLSDEMWKESGLIEGPFPTGGDVYEIDSRGTYVNPGDFSVRTVAFDQSTGDDAPVYNYDLSVQSVFISNSGAERLTKPNICYTLNVEQGTWRRMSLITPAVSSAVTLLTSTTPYMGFTDGELVDPFGAPTGQL